jgi:hypothetical protein
VLAPAARADEPLVGKWFYRWWEERPLPSRCARVSKKLAARLARMDCERDGMALRCDGTGTGWRLYDNLQQCEEDRQHLIALPL